ncbi:MAG: hypothetical protein AUJ96_30495 [Armatimonadetes bacterium CG2_30_66_41]|nr:MAG: hypothetical protein AUJ96_30495 [Armatimonadetes bacterium CG2_30_66_41]PIW20334.1 MAG: hypothetical protein COW34_02080 [Armatimonadetes bacterium CG17_big_fil_post_rev_8_21_14_2_50_66_6]
MLGRRSRRGYTLRFSLGTAFVGIGVVTSGLLGLVTYRSVHSFARQAIRERLRDGVATGALLIDAETHRTLKTRADERSPAYRRIKRCLQEIRKQDAEVRFVYTMRQHAKGQVVFVVDAEESLPDMARLGEVCVSPSPFCLDAFKKPYRAHTEDRFYSDKWGSWLSGYAPFFGKDGRPEGVLGMDISAARVTSYERRHLLVVLREERWTSSSATASWLSGAPRTTWSTMPCSPASPRCSARGNSMPSPPNGGNEGCPSSRRGSV